MNDQSQVIGFRIALLLGPMVAIGAFQFVMNEPAKAHASGVNVEFRSLPIVPESPVATSSENHEAIIASSPFWYEEVELSLPVMPLAARPVDPVQTLDPIFVLSSVLPSANKSFAVVNGKAHAVGDEIEAGWKLIKISGKDRYIILKHTSGRRLRVLMSRN